MRSRFKALFATLAVAVAAGAAAESASAAQSAAVPLVYRGAGTARAGSVSFKSATQWNINRLTRGRYGLAGRVVQSSTPTRWNVYRGTTFVGHVSLGPLGRWRLYRAAKPVGYTKLVAGRWWVYRGTRRVGTVGPSPGGPAAGAGLLLLT